MSTVRIASIVVSVAVGLSACAANRPKTCAAGKASAGCVATEPISAPAVGQVTLTSASVERDELEAHPSDMSRIGPIQASDAAITQLIQQRLTEAGLSRPDLPIDVVTHAGNVTLRGQVRSAGERDDIERVVGTVMGVSGVDDRLTTEASAPLRVPSDAYEQ